jgi:hypothetical protein
VEKWILRAAGAVLVIGFFAAALTAESGLDYETDAQTPIDALARADWRSFYAHQPLMGSFSLWVRAPFVWSVYRESVTIVYWFGSLPCLLAVLGLAFWLVREMQRRGRSDVEQAIVAGTLILSPMTVRAMHWGHPEELLGAVLCVVAVILASRGTGVTAGIVLGCAITTKQWAVIAALPAVVAAPPATRIRLAGAATAVAAALTIPMAIGNFDRFMLIQHAAASADPTYWLYGSRGRSPLPGNHVTPNTLWLLVAFPYDDPHGHIYLLHHVIARLAHPLIVLVALPLTYLLWRRRGGQVDVREALLLLATLMLARCVLDPISLDYYHVPFLTALAAAAALGGAREARLALLAAAGLAIAYATPAESMYQLSEHAREKNAVYLAVTLPLAWALARSLFVRRARPHESRTAALAQHA